MESFFFGKKFVHTLNSERQHETSQFLNYLIAFGNEYVSLQLLKLHENIHLLIIVIAKN